MQHQSSAKIYVSYAYSNFSNQACIHTGMAWGPFLVRASFIINKTGQSLYWRHFSVWYRWFPYLVFLTINVTPKKGIATFIHMYSIPPELFILLLHYLYCVSFIYFLTDWFDKFFHGSFTRYEKLRMHRERFPRHRGQRKPLDSDPGMHHCTCVAHVPWCMSGSLTRGGVENVRGIPGACETRNFTFLVKTHVFSVFCSHAATNISLAKHKYYL